MRNNFKLSNGKVVHGFTVAVGEKRSQYVRDRRNEKSFEFFNGSIEEAIANTERRRSEEKQKKEQQVYDAIRHRQHLNIDIDLL